MKSYENAVAECYSTWGKTYYEEYYGAKAPYPPVHTELLRELLRVSGAKSLLDAGCGPASFHRDVTDLGIELYGFDLTPQMVNEGQRIFCDQGLAPDRIWTGNILDPNAFISPHGPRSYDALVCGGVLPHIPPEEDLIAAKNIYCALNPGGFCAVEARNKFFAMFTLNRYSYEFIVNELIRPDILNGISGANTAIIDQILDEIRNYFRMDVPPVRKGKEDEPGYDEVLSRTHNPILLKNVFEDAGFVNIKLKFYHFHAFPPMFQKLMPELFLERSLSMESSPEDWRGYFMASAFYLVAHKAV